MDYIWTTDLLRWKTAVPKEIVPKDVLGKEIKQNVAYSTKKAVYVDSIFAKFVIAN